jgi:hypothetical protein
MSGTLPALDLGYGALSVSEQIVAQGYRWAEDPHEKGVIQNQIRQANDLCHYRFLTKSELRKVRIRILTKIYKRVSLATDEVTP